MLPVSYARQPTTGRQVSLYSPSQFCNIGNKASEGRTGGNQSDVQVGMTILVLI